MMPRLINHCLIFALLLYSSALLASDKVVKVYHDADYSNLAQSAKAIQMGFMTALAEVDYEVNGYKIEFVERDHRGNVNRSLLNIKQFLKDESALFILGGVHSPPYIKYRDFINENQILLLVPWAAGGSITRYPSAKNWIFRLSVDDTLAGEVLVNAAVDSGCLKPALLLEETGWGRSNYSAITEALMRLDKEGNVYWFHWNTRQNRASMLIEQIVKEGAHCIILVANSIEGAEFAQAMSHLPAEKRIPFISHWGITAGQFYEKIGHLLASDVEFSFIQSCFSFQNEPRHQLAQSVFQRAASLYPNEIAKLGYIKSAVGFIHGYDLAKLFLAASSKIDFEQSKINRANALRQALEQIETPVRGLVKTYRLPFTVWSSANESAHEALTSDDLCMGRYSQGGKIVLIEKIRKGL
ncbi:ABC transporter substrate-binding protein (plasmid) [Pseudoalteromonas sp. T1lg65]|uniref:ABC transporter substrate-binding protein n=1 Tax=Pseudoalteromonas sp. T1lg65 TaxID=2077101 RepID=UPI003F7A7AEB